MALWIDSDGRHCSELPQSFPTSCLLFLCNFSRCPLLYFFFFTLNKFYSLLPLFGTFCHIIAVTEPGSPWGPSLHLFQVNTVPSRSHPQCSSCYISSGQWSSYLLVPVSLLNSPSFTLLPPKFLPLDVHTLPPHDFCWLLSHSCWLIYILLSSSQNSFLPLCCRTSEFTGIAIQHILDPLNAKVLKCSSTSAIHVLVHLWILYHSQSYNSNYFTNYNNYSWLNTYLVPGH